VVIGLMRILAICCLLFLAVGGTASATDGECRDYENPEVRAVVELVEDAVSLVEKEGEAAFKDFSARGSRWFNGDTYIFVHSMDGRLLSNGPFSEMVGKDMLLFRDVTGKPVVRFAIDAVSRYGAESGWVHYLWPQPGTMEPVWKSSYVHKAVAPDGREYFVGAGLYDVPMEKCFVVQMVDEAAYLLEHEGQEVFPYFRSRTGPFLWGETYIFVVGYDGIQYVAPGHRDREGKSIRGRKDIDGSVVLDRMCALLDAQGSGWVHYTWPKPGLILGIGKDSYIRKVVVDGKSYIVGSGIYSE